MELEETAAAGSMRPATLGDSGRTCGGCGEHKPRREYSQHQYRSKSAPRCRACVSTLMLARMDRCAPDNDVCDAPRIDETVGRILMITAFSEDYLVGHVCSAVNRSYAERHGYDFIEARHTPSRRAAPCRAMLTRRTCRSASAPKRCWR